MRTPPSPVGSIGERLRVRRLALGLSQRELSVPGVSYAYISRIEAGTREPSIKALRKLAPRLDVTVGWLETGEESAPRKLAELVLAYDGKPLPEEVFALARRVLDERW